MSAQNEIRNYLISQLDTIENARERVEEIRDCPECGGSGCCGSAQAPAVCRMCNGQKYIVVIIK